MGHRIGVFDSGSGGLTVVAALWEAGIDAEFVYFADTAHLPYGGRPLEEVKGFALGIIERLVREEARKVATGRGLPLVICDGPPGIGCPVISSLTGAKVALVVLEPTMAGLHDAIRVLELTAHFRVFALSCINKWDINPKVASEIERTLGGRGVPVLAKIPYDEEVPKAISSGLPLGGN